jgi:hypothetical protein
MHLQFETSGSSLESGISMKVGCEDLTEKRTQVKLMWSWVLCCSDIKTSVARQIRFSESCPLANSGLIAAPKLTVTYRRTTNKENIAPHKVKSLSR